MKEHRVGRLFASGCLLLVCIFFGYTGWSEYTRISQSPMPESMRLERGVLRTADVILGGEIEDQAIVRLGSYSEFEVFAKKHNEHPIVVARVNVSDGEIVTVQYLLPSKRYYFSEKIRQPWGWFYEFGGLAVDGESIVLSARPEPMAFIPDIVWIFLSFLVSLLIFPWRMMLHLFIPATS